MNMNSPIVMSYASIAANRFGYGARGDELIEAQKDPKKWIIEQLQPIQFSQPYPSSADVFKQHVKYVNARNKRKMSMAGENQPTENMKSMGRKYLRSMSVSSVTEAVSSPHSVSWRLLDFFSNHFSVTSNGQLLTGLSATLEREAIAPNLLGHFSDLLLASVQHPAMIIYLNNEKSIGPNSKQSKKNNKGLNENLAREILELHTLGVDGPYTQEDVLALAKGITGWSISNLRKAKQLGFTFRANTHEPGHRVFMGKRYPQSGIAQGETMLQDLAAHPATARHVCYKLACHFVNETPPSSLVDSMIATWHKTQGNIKAVMTTMLQADEAWLSTPQKFKSPRELVISTLRALGTMKIRDNVIFNSLTALGQEPFNAGSPAGYGDTQQDWLGANALMARIDWATKLASIRSDANAEKIMHAALNLAQTSHTYLSVVRAESRQHALALLLLSPEFQRR